MYIGHSRGGALNAVLANVLGIESNTRMVSLDAYSSDWSFPGGLLSNLDLSKNEATEITCDSVNYIADKGLVFDPEVLSFLKNKIGNALSLKFFNAKIDDLVAQAQSIYQTRLKAPSRINFDRNVVLAGTVHTNISSHFLGARLLSQDFLGGKCSSSGSGDRPGAGEGSLDSPSIYDGDLQEAAHIVGLINDLVDSSTDSSEIAAIFKSFEADYLGDAWLAKNNVSFEVTNGKRWLVLNSSDSEFSTVSATASLPAGDAILRFDVSVDQPSSNSLEVLLGSMPIAELTFAQTGQFQRVVKVSTSDDLSYGRIQFRWKIAPSAIKIGNFQIERMPDSRPFVTPTSARVNTPTQFGLEILGPTNFGEGINYYISDLTGGSLYLHDGKTAIQSRDFISHEQARQGLVFLGTPDSFLPGRFSVQAATSSALESLIGEATTVVINIDKSSTWMNSKLREDVNRDGIVSPLDALLQINKLNSGFRGPLAPIDSVPTLCLDVSGDNSFSPLDVLLVINYLNKRMNKAEGELATGSLQTRLAIPYAGSTFKVKRNQLRPETECVDLFFQDVY